MASKSEISVKLKVPQKAIPERNETGQISETELTTARAKEKPKPSSQTTSKERGPPKNPKPPKSTTRRSVQERQTSSKGRIYTSDASATSERTSLLRTSEQSSTSHKEDSSSTSALTESRASQPPESSAFYKKIYTSGKIIFMKDNKRVYEPYRKYDAKYLKINADAGDTESILPQVAECVVDEMWQVRYKNLLLSVTDGADELDEDGRNTFTEGLKKLLPGTCMVTGGTNDGVTQLVGDAVSVFNKKKRLTPYDDDYCPTIGIVCVDNIQNKDTFKPLELTRGAFGIDSDGELFTVDKSGKRWTLNPASLTEVKVQSDVKTTANALTDDVHDTSCSPRFAVGDLVQIGSDRESVKSAMRMLWEESMEKYLGKIGLIVEVNDTVLMIRINGEDVLYISKAVTLLTGESFIGLLKTHFKTYEPSDKNDKLVQAVLKDDAKNVYAIINQAYKDFIELTSASFGVDISGNFVVVDDNGVRRAFNPDDLTQDSITNAIESNANQIPRDFAKGDLVMILECAAKKKYWEKDQEKTLGKVGTIEDKATDVGLYIRVCGNSHWYSPWQVALMNRGRFDLLKEHYKTHKPVYERDELQQAVSEDDFEKVTTIIRKAYKDSERLCEYELPTTIDDLQDKANTARYLKPLHDLFVLVEDSTLMKFGGEIEFRANLEKRISSEIIRSRMQEKTKLDGSLEQVPVVNVVVKGGQNTLEIEIVAFEKTREVIKQCNVPEKLEETILDICWTDSLNETCLMKWALLNHDRAVAITRLVSTDDRPLTVDTDGLLKSFQEKLKVESRKKGLETIRQVIKKMTERPLHGMTSSAVEVNDWWRLPATYSSDEQQHTELQYWDYMFLWTLLSRKHDLAKILWTKTKHPLFMALLAHNLCEAVKQNTNDKVLIAEMKKSISEWSSATIDCLNECYQNSEEATFVHLTMTMPFWNNKSCLDLAEESSNMEFLAQQACRHLVGDIWNGQRMEQDKFEKLEYPAMYAWKNKQIKFVHKIQAPKRKFAYNVISYLVFLSLFAYVLLFDLPPTVSVSEFVLMTLVLTILVEEIRQMHQIYQMHGYEKASSCKQRIGKLKNYFSEGWNCIDMFAIVMFLLGLGLRFKQFRDTFDWPRVVLAVDFVAFFFRLVHIFSVQKTLGPKLIIILRMVQDLLYFLVIMAVFLLAYAIASYSILYPDAPVTWETARQIIRKPYWHLYGELFLDETEDLTDCTNVTSLWTNGTSPRCPSETGNIVVPIMRGVYLLFSNILLLNLLIAMFSYTFQEIHEQSDKIWCFQRYVMVKEYALRPVFCPPFNVFWHIYQVFHCCLHKCTISERVDDSFHTPYDDEFDFKINDRNITLSAFMQEAAGRYAQNRKRYETENNASRIKAAHEKLDHLAEEEEKFRNQAMTSFDALNKKVENLETKTKAEEEFRNTMLTRSLQAAEREDEFRRLVLAQLNKMQESIDVLHRKKADSEHKAD